MTPVPDWYARYLGVCNEHAFERLGEFVHDDVVVNDVQVGLAGYVAGLRSVVEAFPDYLWTARHVLADGGLLFAHLRDTGRHTGEWLGAAPTGRVVDVSEFAVYAVRDGRIARVWVTADNESVRAQLG